jgi:eukaryotic-like serine/threonine-protein kinase
VATGAPGRRCCRGCGRPVRGPSFGPRPGYRIDAFLGSGYYADVFRALDLATGGAYAAKVYADEPAKRQAAAREADALRRLAHPRLPAFKAAFDDGGWAFVVMELVEGANLRDEVTTHGPLALDQVVTLGLEACEVFQYVASQRWTYRDLHPKNIHRATPKGAMLVDFDGARPPEWPAHPGGRIGYRAPERDEGGRLTPACDIYSLAGCLSFALTSEDPPERPGPLPDLRARLASAPQLADALDDCRRADPARRPSVDALRAALERTRASER